MGAFNGYGKVGEKAAEGGSSKVAKFFVGVRNGFGNEIWAGLMKFFR